MEVEPYTYLLRSLSARLNQLSDEIADIHIGTIRPDAASEVKFSYSLNRHDIHILDEKPSLERLHFEVRQAITRFDHLVDPGRSPRPTSHLVTIILGSLLSAAFVTLIVVIICWMCTRDSSNDKGTCIQPLMRMSCLMAKENVKASSAEIIGPSTRSYKRRRASGLDDSKRPRTSISFQEVQTDDFCIARPHIDVSTSTDRIEQPMEIDGFSV